MLALISGGTTALNITTAPQALASDTDTYSWHGAAALDENTDDYGYAQCLDNDSGCKRLTYTLNGVVYGESDPWGYSVRNCTSYVAEKISQEFSGRNISGWGNASNWKNAAVAAHYPLDTTPQVGDIAVWVHAAGGLGHVAYVYSVSNGVATFDEYNVAETGDFTSSYTSANHPGDDGQTHPDYYIHMGTPKDGGGSPPPQDSDHDGTPDSTDTCPQVAGPANNRGCPLDGHTVAGDFNGDGKTDVLSIYDYGSNNVGAWLFAGNESGVSKPQLLWTTGNGQWQWSASTFVAGDFNGDGYADAVGFYDYGNADLVRQPPLGL
jgi:surface antigen